MLTYLTISKMEAGANSCSMVSKAEVNLTVTMKYGHMQLLE